MRKDGIVLTSNGHAIYLWSIGFTHSFRTVKTAPRTVCLRLKRTIDPLHMEISVQFVERHKYKYQHKYLLDPYFQAKYQKCSVFCISRQWDDGSQ